MNKEESEFSAAAAALGRKGGSVKSSAKSEAAKARNAARKAEGKPQGGRPKVYHLGYPFTVTSTGKIDCNGTQCEMLPAQIERFKEIADTGDVRKAYQYIKRVAKTHDVYSPVSGQQFERDVIAEREARPTETRFSK